MLPLSLIAPAKINLFLHINGRRKDGYHELQTFFQLLDYGDQLTFAAGCKTNHTHLTTSDNGLISLQSSLENLPHEANLVCKAADLLVTFAHLKGCAEKLFPISIELTKRLPVGGGLGGGSSDAATTLLALNKIWNLDISTTKLAGMSLSLGADVPMFVNGCTAYAEGIGERLQTRTTTEYWYLIVQPPCHVSTAEVFSHKELTRDTPKSRIMPALEGDPSALALGLTLASNDCEIIVCRLYPEIRQAMNWLNQHAKARLTGTGSCIFACFTEPNLAKHVLTQLPADYQGFVARGINQSPVVDALNARHRKNFTKSD